MFNSQGPLEISLHYINIAWYKTIVGWDLSTFLNYEWKYMNEKRMISDLRGANWKEKANGKVAINLGKYALQKR